MMRYFLSVLLLVLTPIAAFPAIGDWKVYMAYSEVQQIVAVGDNLFVRASNSLYLYNKSDESITTFDKTTGMSDVTINHISWNSLAERLVVVYDNSNIDLVDIWGSALNVSDLYNKTMTEDKTVNSITNYGRYAYLATNFGGLKIDVVEAEVSESYLFGIQAQKIAVSGQNIYIRKTNGEVITAPLTASNLQDFAFWSPTTSYPSGIFDDDLTAYNENIDVVKTLNPGGPKYNYCGFLKFHNGVLYSCNGTWKNLQPAALQSMKDGEWTVYGDETISEQTGRQYQDIVCFDFDPMDDSHIMAGSRNGLYEFRNGQFSQYFDYRNSPIEVFDGKDVEYQLTTAVKYDDSGNLWCFNSEAPSQSLLKYTSNGIWEEYPKSVFKGSTDTKSFKDVRGLMFDSRGLLWGVNNDWRPLALFYYDIDDDTVKVYSDFTNQDGTTATMSYIRCVAEDRDNNIWVGTNVGPYYLTPSDISNGNDVFTQYKVPRNDGTNLADYLLSGIDAYCLAIDGGNRKWFGTNGNGVYVISSDNNTEEYHFTAENSSLLSDNVMSIAIDGTTGEVYIGTDKGLCSYRSDVSEPTEEMNEDNVYAYPNPVTPDHTGLITVTGLTYDADVKITTATGYLVAEGRSKGGTFTWDGCDRNGKRVASGVYSVLTATSDGSKGAVCKIAIIR